MTKKQKIITAIAIPVLLLGGFIVVKAALKSKKMTPPTPAPKKKGKIVVQETEIINEEDYFAAEEDFGIVVPEALSCGTPVIALRKGGTKETVIDGVTGVHYDEQTEDSIIGAVSRFESIENTFDSGNISNIAKGYSRERFEKEIHDFVETKAVEFFS